MNGEFESKKQLANRENGRKGGESTAAKYSESHKDWGKKGGCTTRDTYSSDFFRFINSKRRIKKGWPLGKMRKPVTIPEDMSDTNRQILQQMLGASTSNG